MEQELTILRWDDKLADYVYSYSDYTGDSKWAKRIAKHYNITMPTDISDKAFKFDIKWSDVSSKDGE